MPGHALDGRVILLTGAAGGIGSVTAAALTAQGARLIGHYCGSEERERLESALADVPATHKYLLDANFEKPTQAARQLWQTAVAWQGHVDVVILNAAALLWAGFEDSDDQWRESWAVQLAVNLMAPVELMRVAVPHFQSRGGGVLITVGSWNAQRGATNPTQIAYTASKAAVVAAAKSIARGYAQQNIQSHIVSPGIVGTWMSFDFAEKQGGAERVLAKHPLKEFIPPEELATLIAYLSTGEAGPLSGATLDVNGGAYIR
jgi:NAD(P)-dependent dehydrogenase (short-subunit alcohol dehydrogenase family)